MQTRTTRLWLVSVCVTVTASRIGLQLLTSNHEHSARSLLSSCEIAAPNCRGAVVKVQLHGPGVVVAFSGEIDGSNGDQVSAHAHRFVPPGGAFLLDLTDVGFLGVDGLRALIGLGDECARRGVACAVVAGESVIRLLRAVGRSDLLKSAASVAEAQSASAGTSRPN